MARSVTFQLTANNVAGQVVTLPAGYSFKSLLTVELIDTGDYTATSNDAPGEQTIVTGTLSTTGVKLTAPNQLTFGSTVVLDTTYGSVAVSGTEAGDVGFTS